MDSNRFHELADQFSQKHILVIGDLMLDTYMWGEINRISPEAPVPVVSVQKVTHNPGGAANVSWNIASLNGNVSMLGILGEDESGTRLLSIMKERGIDVDQVIQAKDISTTVKTRVIAQGQQVVRTDRESTGGISSELESTLLDGLNSMIGSVDAVILADYNKGLLSENMIGSILSSADKTNVPVYVDPKHDHFFAFTGVRLFKPNAAEFSLAMNSVDQKDGSNELREKISADHILVTLGSEGMLLTTHDESVRITTKARAVHDVSGAGDTVISVYALADQCGASPEEAATLANLAAGRVCEEVGVVPINLNMLTEMLNHHNS